MAKWLADFFEDYYCSECGRYVKQEELVGGRFVPDKCPKCGAVMGCEYCESSKDFADKREFPSVEIKITNYGCLAFDNSSGEYGSGYSLHIKYCPMCGKEL